MSTSNAIILSTNANAMSTTNADADADANAMPTSYAVPSNAIPTITMSTTNAYAMSATNAIVLPTRTNVSPNA